ncbi:MAG TPA: hypothetical protein VNM38_09655 [Solirubrobacterales bacterium]|nr:hypothetical protein [Solirubrobacterales bacterium]
MKAICNAVLLVCVAALLALPPVASGAAGKTHEFKLGKIEVEPANGHEIEVSTLQEDKKRGFVAVDVAKGPLRADYEVRSEMAPGIHATFGSLGQIDVSFQHRKRVVTHPEPNCTWVFERGVFRGSFRFVGEGGYVTSEEVNPPGTVFRLPRGFCGFRVDRRARPFLGLEQRVLAVRGSEEGRIVSFQASEEEFVDRPSFNASLIEKVEGMNIERRTRIHGAKGSFTSTGTARGSVHPPAPFVGSALFRDPAGAPADWAGSLMVSFLGAPEVALAGEAFMARLCPRISIAA